MALPKAVNLTDLAKLLRLTTRRVTQLAAEDVIPKTERGRYDLLPAVHGYVTYLQERATGRAETTGAGPMGDAKARLYAARAEQAEVDLRRSKGELIPAEAVGVFLASIVMDAQRELVGLPARLRQMNPGVSHRVIEDAERIVGDALNALAAARPPEHLFEGVAPGDRGMEGEAEEET